MHRLSWIPTWFVSPNIHPIVGSSVRSVVNRWKRNTPHVGVVVGNFITAVYLLAPFLPDEGHGTVGHVRGFLRDRILET